MISSMTYIEGNWGIRDSIKGKKTETKKSTFESERFESTDSEAPIGDHMAQRTSSIYISFALYGLLFTWNQN